jgi:RNase H-fold protein (predicted Holliday junction resolvase)
MRKIILIILIIFITIISNTFCTVETMKKKQFLTVNEAQTFAIKGFEARKSGLSREYHAAWKDTRAATPLLVQWIDRTENYYYIVPFNRNKVTTLLIMIDAITGRFKRSSYLRTPFAFPRIDKKTATNILKKYFLKTKQNAEKISDPQAVWKPCEQTQSPYEPLWKIIVENNDWYIDQKGKVYERIIETKLKGGGI